MSEEPGESKFLYFILIALLITLFQYVGGTASRLGNSFPIVLTESISACMLIIVLGSFFVCLEKIYNKIFGVEYE